MKDFRLEIKVRNNRILKAIQDSGYESIPEFAKYSKVSYNRILDYISFKLSPINKKTGLWCKTALRLAEDLGVIPEEIFPYTTVLKNNTTITELDKEDIIPFLSGVRNHYTQIEDITKKELKQKLSDSLTKLTPRQVQILTLRFGLDGEEEKTLEQTAEIIGLNNRERVRQIEHQAFRKIKKTEYCKTLKSFL